MVRLTGLLLGMLVLFASAPLVAAETTGVVDGARPVVFRLKAAEARKVNLAGSFNDWNANALEMSKTSSGDFVTTLPLAPGKYEYKFVLDGSEWIADPNNPAEAEDNHGGKNSVLNVAAGNATTSAAPAESVESTAGPAVERLPNGKNQVTFRFKSPQAQRVFLAGSFNGWSANRDLMVRSGDEHTTTVVLEDGEYHYKFIVNGTHWTPDPQNPEGSDDGNGGQNSVVRVGPTAHIRSNEQVGDGKLLAEALHHEPQSIEYVNPLPDGRTIIKLRAMANDTSSAAVLAGSTSIPMKTEYADKRFEFFRAVLPAEHGTTGARTLTYSITAADPPVIATLRANGVTTATSAQAAPFTRTISEAEMFSTPDWAKKVVWYEIFPERFRNGNTANDPKTTAGILAWTSDWYKPGPDEHNAALEPGIYQRRYGGDLQGCMEKLPYLKELGVGAIWFNPVFEAESLHKYDATDYRHIDDDFGIGGEYEALAAQEDLLDASTWKWSGSDKLFLDFIKRAHGMGIKVVVDGVFNHTGTLHPAFIDLRTKGQESRFQDWYQVKNWSPFEYEGWAGFGGLPVFKEDEKGFVDPTLRKHILEVTRRWMDPNGDGDPSDGIDGWRLDVPNEVSSDFWREWRRTVKSVNPDAIIIGEIWDPPAKWLRGDQFDSVMNYQMAKALHRFFNNKGKASALQQDFARLLHEVPDQANSVMMNLMNSHDTDRLVSQMANPNRDYDARNRQQDVKPGEYTSAKPSAEVYKRMKALVAVQFGYVGSPMIYYGDEVGMWGADDPEDRKPMLWKDLQPYEKPEDNFVMDDIYAHFQRCAAIRNSSPALQVGEYSPLFTDDAARVFAYRRSTKAQDVIVLTNDSAQPQTVSLPLGEGVAGEYLDLLNDPAVKVLPDTKAPRGTHIEIEGKPKTFRASNGSLQVNIEPYTTRILMREQGIRK